MFHVEHVFLFKLKYRQLFHVEHIQDLILNSIQIRLPLYILSAPV